jgi:hypothetical protein
MKNNVLLFILSLIYVQVIHAKDNSEYSRTYAILINGAVVGHEKVVEKLNNAGQMVSTSEHDLMITDGLVTKRMAFSTKMVFSKNSYDPISYNYEYTEGNTGDSYDVTIKSGQITRSLRRGGRTNETTAPFTPGMVILDYNVYHQYDYLIRKYNKKKGGKQLFADFLPIIGLDIPVALTFLEDASLDFNNKAFPVRNFRVDFVGVVTLSVDKEDRLVRLQIPAQDIEVIREDLLPK